MSDKFILAFLKYGCNVNADFVGEKISPMPPKPLT
jgi:hypothetical protein